MGSGCEDGNCGLASGFLEDCSNQECQWEEPMFGLIDFMADNVYNHSIQNDYDKTYPIFHILVCVTVIYIPLMLFGLLGNILTILVVWLRPHMRSSTYLYLSSMAVSDLLILLLLPLDLYKLWRPRPWPLGDLACKLTMFLSECCTFCTILHITFLSLERYLAVCWPITAKTLVTRRRTRVLIGCLWLGAAVSAAPVLLMVGVEDEVDTECRCTHYAVSSGLLSAMMILSNLYFLVPLCILGLVYSLIGRTLWLRPQSSRRDQSHRHTVKMLGVIVLAFILCWLPFHVGRTIFSLSLGSDLYFLYYLSQYFNLVSSVLFYLSAAVNPLLYNLMSARYRHAVHSLMHTHSHTQSLRMRTLTTRPSTTTL
uniref:Growth hormone secretagogue receptor type 1 n=1 Tax=Sander lucioperca TaxID=283035 RepID=A0A8C9X496_SANLU